MTRTARDVMESHVVSVGPDDPLSAVQRLFLDEEIHGAPVVAEDGRVMGVVTDTDLVRAALERLETLGPSPSDAGLEDEPSRGAGVTDPFTELLGGALVADCMTDGIVSVTSDTPAREVARVMRDKRIHRVLVIDDETLVGIVSSLDLLDLV